LDQYRDAVEEMLHRTTTPYAPWTIVESNCKRYARVKVLETVCEAIRQRLVNCRYPL
jgi:polyphosphate kinase 2 (PPK2 family)